MTRWGQIVRLVTISGLVAVLLGGCAGTPTGTDRPTTGEPGGSSSLRKYPLTSLPTTTVTIGDHAFRVWLAQDFDPERPGVAEEGLMYVRPEQIAADQGMLFVFYEERVRGFWMLNTLTPLDIAYARFDGTIVTIRQMAALTTQTYSSIEPAMFALEVPQGTFARLGIHEGDRMIVPDEALVVP